MKNKKQYSRESVRNNTVRIFCLILAALMVLGTLSYVLFIIAAGL